MGGRCVVSSLYSFGAKMSTKLDDYRVIDTISCDGRLGLKQLVCRLSDRRLFESRQISYKFMDDALKEVNNATICCNKIQTSSNGELLKQMVVSEINSLKKLRHPNVIHHEDIIVRREASTLYVITECGENDTLQTLIDSHIKSVK